MEEQRITAVSCWCRGQHWRCRGHSILLGRHADTGLDSTPQEKEADHDRVSAPHPRGAHRPRSFGQRPLVRRALRRRSGHRRGHRSRLASHRLPDRQRHAHRPAPAQARRRPPSSSASSASASTTSPSAAPTGASSRSGPAGSTSSASSTVASRTRATAPASASVTPTASRSSSSRRPADQSTPIRSGPMTPRGRAGLVLGVVLLAGAFLSVTGHGSRRCHDCGSAIAAHQPDGKFRTPVAERRAEDQCNGKITKRRRFVALLGGVGLLIAMAGAYDHERRD